MEGPEDQQAPAPQAAEGQDWRPLRAASWTPHRTRPPGVGQVPGEELSVPWTQTH